MPKKIYVGKFRGNKREVFGEVLATKTLVLYGLGKLGKFFSSHIGRENNYLHI